MIKQSYTIYFPGEMSAADFNSTHFQASGLKTADLLPLQVYELDIIC